MTTVSTKHVWAELRCEAPLIPSQAELAWNWLGIGLELAWNWLGMWKSNETHDEIHGSTLGSFFLMN